MDDRPSPEPTAEGWGRLWDAVSPHPGDSGNLGEYALLLRRRGPAAARDEFPDVVAHLESGCARCAADLPDLLAFAEAELRAEAADERRGAAEPGWLQALFQRLRFAPAPIGDQPDEAARPSTRPPLGPPSRRGTAGWSGAPPLPTLELDLAGHPGLMLRASPRGEGSLFHLIRPAETPEPAATLGGWRLRVTPAGADEPLEAVTNRWGAVVFERLPFDDLAGARVDVRPPPDDAAGPIG